MKIQKHKLLKVLSLFFIISLLLFSTSVMVLAVEEYNEAPELADLVEKGELPPVEERLPKEPLVESLIEGTIGKYGGELKSVYGGPTQRGPLTQSFLDISPVWVSPDMEVNPAILTKWEWIDESTFRIYLREGIKWSDGHPVTVDDIIYSIEAYHEIPFYSGSSYVASRCKKEMKKQGDYVLDLYPNDTYGLMYFYLRGLNLEPAHYLKQFDPRFNSDMEMEDLEQVWSPNRMSEALIDKPVLDPWKMESYDSGRTVFKRNPYYWAVDEEGNQLPYIDKWVFRELESPNDTTPALAKAGEILFQNRHILVEDYQFYKRNEDNGDYRVIILEMGSLAPSIKINYGVEDEKLRELFWNLDFRIALSLGVNREAISYAVYYGQTEPHAYTALRESPVFPGEEYEKMYTEYDPERAKEILENIGLKDRNGDGYRQYPDGGTVSIILDYEINEVGGPPHVMEMITEQWRQIGLEIHSNPLKISLLQSRWQANSWQLNAWRVDGALLPFSRKGHWATTRPLASPYTGNCYGREINRWYATDGEEGVEPPEHIKKMNEYFAKANSALDEDEQIEYGKKHAAVTAETLVGIPTTTNMAIAIANKNLVTPETWRFSYLTGGLNEGARPWMFYFKE